jgi:hypothetical protein
LALAGSAAAAGPAGDLAAFEAFGVRLDDGELQDLRRGSVVAKILDHHRPSELAVFAASRIEVSPDRFFDALQHSATLWRGPKVPRSGAFDQPLDVGDIDAMRLPDEDLDALRHCRPGDCDVKLAASEMVRVQAAIDAAPRRWRWAAQEAFNALVLDRIRAYRQRGLAGLPAIHDHEDAIAPGAAFSRLAGGLAQSPAVDPLVEYLRDYPRVPLQGRAEHLFWLEVGDSPKPTIQAAHMVIARRADDAAVEVVAVSRQIFATHYVNASLSIVVLARARNGDRFMLYVNRSSVDGLDGFLSGVKRLVIGGRVRRAARGAVEHLRRRIENDARSSVMAPGRTG